MKIQLSKVFDMKDLGNLRDFLGLEVGCTSKGRILSQQKQTLYILAKFGMTDSKPIDTPAEVNAKLRKDDG